MMARTMYRHLVVPLLLLCAALQGSILAVDTSTTTDDGQSIPQLLAQADALLTGGRGAEAIALYDDAVERDATSFVGGMKSGCWHQQADKLHLFATTAQSVQARHRVPRSRPE